MAEAEKCKTVVGKLREREVGCGGGVDGICREGGERWERGEQEGKGRKMMIVGGA